MKVNSVAKTGQNNLDLMMEMMKSRHLIKSKFLTSQKSYFTETSYRPYQIRTAPLQAKDNNSVLMNSILPVVKNKKVVDYRINYKSNDWKRVRVDNSRINSMIDQDFVKIRDRLNVSSRV